jgi:hypothetical protein
MKHCCAQVALINVSLGTSLAPVVGRYNAHVVSVSHPVIAKALHNRDTS